MWRYKYKSRRYGKNIGINIDKKLKFNSHITEVIRKCAYQLNALKWKSKILNTETKMLIYHVFIEANLNYCPLIWMNRNKTDMKHIENVQKQTLRMVFNDYSSSYQELLKWAKTCTLEIRWKRQLVTEVYKATHNLTPPYITSLFPSKIVNYDLRSNMPISQSKISDSNTWLSLPLKWRNYVVGCLVKYM